MVEELADNFCWEIIGIKFSELFRAGLRVKMKGHLGRLWPRCDRRLIDLDFLGGGFIRFFMFNPIFGEMI